MRGNVVKRWLMHIHRRAASLSALSKLCFDRMMPSWTQASYIEGKSYLTANLLVDAVGGDGDSKGVVLDLAGFQVEVGSRAGGLVCEAQHALLRDKPAAFGCHH